MTLKTCSGCGKPVLDCKFNTTFKGFLGQRVYICRRYFGGERHKELERRALTKVFEK